MIRILIVDDHVMFREGLKQILAKHSDMRVVDDIKPTDTDQAGRWLWLKGPKYQLQPGALSYVFDGYHGGAKLDKVLLTRDLDYVPQGLGEPQSFNVATHLTGWAETRDLRLVVAAEDGDTVDDMLGLSIGRPGASRKRPRPALLPARSASEEVGALVVGSEIQAARDCRP